MLSKAVLNKIEKYAKKDELVIINVEDTNASYFPSKMPKNPDRVYFIINIKCGGAINRFEVTKKIKLDDLRELDKIYHKYDIIFSGIPFDLALVFLDVYGDIYFDPRR